MIAPSASTRISACGISRSERPSEASQKPPSPAGAMPSRSSFCAGLAVAGDVDGAATMRAGAAVASIVKMRGCMP